MPESHLAKKYMFAGVLLSIALAVSACTTDSSEASDAGAVASTSGGAPLSIGELCGSEPIRMVLLDGDGSSTWRVITHGELVDEMSACDNVTVEYADAGGELQNYIGMVNSFSAQGYDAIITNNDFGSQSLAALSEAFRAGTAVVPFSADPGGEVGVDYSGYVAFDFNEEGRMKAEWVASQIEPGGRVIFMGGLEGGAPRTQQLFDGVLKTNASLGTPMNILNNVPIPTNWDPSLTQQSMAGAIAQYGEFDGWISDYGVADIGGLRSLSQAGLEFPVLATNSSDNSVGCFFLEHQAEHPEFQLFSLDGTTQMVRVAGRKALAAINGLPDNEPEGFILEPFIDTANGKFPECRDDLPPDADLSSGLTEEQLVDLFR